MYKVLLNIFIIERNGNSMEKEMILDYINLFREKAECGKLVVFVGAGVSCNVSGMPSWITLVEKMAEAIGYSKCFNCKHQKDGCKETCFFVNDFSIDEFLKIPQYVFNKDNGKLYNQILMENIKYIDVDAPLSFAVFDINPVHIITTNYDTLLESSKNVFCEQYDVIVHDKDLLNAEKSKYIIKMHGDLSQPETIILKEQDYLDYSQKHVLIELFVKSLLADHTILFLGYSLNDYNIKLIISWINFMRLQNNALNDSQKVGYIVLDNEQISEIQASYFDGNKIGVININKMPLINPIPDSLNNEKGKRLYSFLRVIADPSLEEGLAPMEHTVRFMSRHNFVDYEQILQLLYVKHYKKIDSTLHLFSEQEYDRLVQFMSCGIPESSQLKQLFINSGVLSLFCSNSKQKNFIIGVFSENAILHDELYKLYIQNEYKEIKTLLKNEKSYSMREYFYNSLISGYDTTYSDYINIDFSTLKLNEKIAYLHNTAAIDAFKNFRFDSSKVVHFINNISSTKEKILFSAYIDIYEGNSKKLLNMKIASEKLKSDVNSLGKISFSETSYPDIYKIKNIVTTQYFFYFFNYVFYEGFSDAKNLFKPYIEAILCANVEQTDKPTCFGNIKFAKEKYSIDLIDFDIITKFISTKDLIELLRTYKITRLNTTLENVCFLSNCFRNLCNSLVKAQTYGFQNSSFSVLANLACLLNLVELNNECRKTIECSIETLFLDKSISKFIFSINCPDFKFILNAFTDICISLQFSTHLEIVNEIVNNDNFYQYAINVNFNNLRSLLLTFLNDEDFEEIENGIKDIIEKTDNFQHKIILLRLFYKCIKSNNLREYYTVYLSSNFTQLSIQAIYDFVFNNWLIPDQKGIDAFLKGILETQRNQKKGVYPIPDPVESKLECAYLLHINDTITDISILKDLASERDHLKFLLHPETFDYTQVDFSNYMWTNFAKHEKYMKFFVLNKNKIIPKIKERIREGNAGEDEKKILYGFLLTNNDIWEEI